jgi:hypothetical protein
MSDASDRSPHTSAARAANPVMFATARLIPCRFLSRGTPGITLDGISQHCFVHLPRGAETEVDEVGAGVCGPVDAGDQGRHVRRQRPVEHLDGEQLCVGRLFTDRRGDRRPVAEPVQVVRAFDAVLVDRDATRDLADVWMRGMDAAVDHGHAHAAAGQHRDERRARKNARVDPALSSRLSALSATAS